MTWISVKDRLPPPGSKMNYTDGRIVGTCVDNVFGLFLLNPDGTANLQAQVLDITYWQPLPEPPNPRVEEFAKLIREIVSRPNLFEEVREAFLDESKHQYAEC